jgi:LacI family transcriptional regulator
VLGFDDIVEASRLGPGLSTVRQPLREMGRVAVQRLIGLLADPAQPPVRVLMDTELVVRNTTAAPRRARTTAGATRAPRAVTPKRADPSIAGGAHEGAPGR